MTNYCGEYEDVLAEISYTALHLDQEKKWTTIESFI